MNLCSCRHDSLARFGSGTESFLAAASETARERRSMDATRGVKVGTEVGAGSVAALSVVDVRDWLEFIGFEKYVDAFERECVCGRSLLELARISEVEPSTCYRIISDQFGVKRFGDVLSFTQELRGLLRLASMHEKAGSFPFAESTLKRVNATGKGVRMLPGVDELNEREEKKGKGEQGWRSVLGHLGGGWFGTNEDSREKKKGDGKGQAQIEETWRGMDMGEEGRNHAADEASRAGSVKIATQYFAFDGHRDRSGVNLFRLVVSGYDLCFCFRWSAE